MYSMAVFNNSSVKLHSRILIYRDTEIMKQTTLQCTVNAHTTLFLRVLMCYSTFC
jgi:hypothetical protein